MLGALLYLRLTSLKNVILSRVRRLRQPKYLAGAIVGSAYFYFVFFRGIGHRPNRPQAFAGMSPDQMIPTNTTPLFLALGAVALLLVVLFMWILPSQSPGLSFSQAETAFLFPAPISRRALIHFKLLSNQLSVLLQSLFFSLVFNARSLSGGRALHIVIGWWMILTLVNLHYMGSSLALARLFERGVSVVRRRVAFLCAITLVVGATFVWIWRDLHAPTASDMADVEAMARWLASVLDAGLLHWLLLPFKWVLAPFFATGMKAFALSLWPALLLLIGHYFWVLSMEASFEEASLAQAEKRAARRAGMRAGTYQFGQGARRARRGPFRLADTGRAEVAFLWKNLLSTRSFLNVRVWLVCAAGIIVGSQIIAGLGPWQQKLLSTAGIAAIVLGLYVLIFGPLLARLDLRSDLAHADVLKTYPLPGWRIVLGELLAPIAILTGIIWLMLLAGVSAIQPTQTLPDWLQPGLRVTYVCCFAAMTPVLVTLQLIVPNAAAVVFPAWFQATRAVGGGIDLMGQRLIFVFGQLFVIVLALIPAAATASTLVFVTQWIVGPALAVIFATAVVVAILLGETWCALWWLGGRFEQFDLSSEQRP
ncbi:MAG: putative ABC exporter domain-containing protein [Opitutus sp.]